VDLLNPAGGRTREEEDQDQLLSMREAPEAILVPCCDRCQDRIRRARFAWDTEQTVLGMTALVVATLVGIVFGLKTGQLLILVPVLAFVLMLPFMIWRVARPVAVDLTFQPATITYVFASDTYASDFARMNPSATG
jgi:hypothetical protein